ncbi:hypothetical protein HGA13_18640 [Nocardia speluncae]|uniref:Uncharacterized protein n=1 Tax=Nocardia speluncae TaxID=419477 RepID=A0A846XF99_9NOCA|nr:hypothetical protein [Nocardia speluncae]NKY35071.1 hypothetical protein [Nocardia speluncae]
MRAARKRIEQILAQAADTDSGAIRRAAGVPETAANKASGADSDAAALVARTVSNSWWSPGVAVPEMRARTLVLPEDFVDDGDGVQFLRSTDGMRNVYRPIDREFHMRQGIPKEPGHLAIRAEVAYRSSSLFRMPRIPPTVISGGPMGRGVVQDFVPSTDFLDDLPYDLLQQQEMAFLDYFLCYSDGNRNNYRTALSSKRYNKGDLVGCDRDLCMHEKPDPNFGIRSPFVEKFNGKKFDDEILERIHAVNEDQVPGIMQNFGPDLPVIGDRAIEGAQSRLLEVQKADGITGEKWPGIIYKDPK